MSEIIQIIASSYTIILLNRTETDHQQYFPSKILFIISRSIRKRNRYYEYNDSLRFPQQYQTSPAPTATSIELNLNKYQISPFKKKNTIQSWLKKKNTNLHSQSYQFSTIYGQGSALKRYIIE